MKVLVLLHPTTAGPEPTSNINHGNPPAMKLHPQEVSHYTVDLVEENAAGVVGMELDCGLVNKTTKEHVPAECSQAPTVQGGAHISDWDLRLGTRWGKV